MIIVNNPNSYSTFGTFLPQCRSEPFSGDSYGLNIGGIGILTPSVLGVRVVGIRINLNDYFFNKPVEIIDRINYSTIGIVPNVSKLVGESVRSLYENQFSLIGVPFLFTLGWDPILMQNYTAHAIDNSDISGHDNATAYMIYQFKNNSGVWGANYSGSYNGVSTTALAINSDIDPYVRCCLENIKKIELKSLYTQQPDVILEGIKKNPTNMTIDLTYNTHLSISFIDQLFYPILQKGTATNSKIRASGFVNMSISLKSKLQNLGWTVSF